MSEENLNSIRTTFELFLRTGELDLDRLDDAAVIRDHDIPDSRDYRGKRGFVRWVSDWGEAWDEWSIEPEEYLDAGDKVVILFRLKVKGRSSGIEVERHDALVYEYRGDKIVAVDYYNSPEQALAAAGIAQAG